MKRYKRVLILLGVLVLVCGGIFAFLQFEEKQEQIQNSQETILAIPVDSIQSVHWVYEETDLAFTRNEESVWKWSGDEAFPVDQETMTALLVGFEDFSVSFRIDEVEDYSQYGLTEPICTVELTTADQTYTLTLGNYSNLDQQRYVSIGDGNAYLVSTDPLDTFDAVLSDLIDHDELPFVETATQIDFSGAVEYQVVYEAYEEGSDKTYCASDVYFTDGKPLDTERVNTWLDELSYLSLTDYVSYNVTDEELAAYGLDEPELSVTVAYNVTTTDDEGEEVVEEQKPFTLHLGRDPAQLAAEQEASESEGTEEVDTTDETAEEEEYLAYARVGESQIVYQITESEYTALLAASYDDLRHPEVLTADFSDVTQVDVTLEGQTHSLTTQPELDEDGEETGSLLWFYGEEELDIVRFRSALTGLSAAEFTAEEPAGQEEIALTVHLNNEQFPTVNMILYRYDGKNCLAVVDGETMCLLDRALVVDLIEAVQAIVLS